MTAAALSGMPARDRAALIGGGTAIFLLIFIFDVRPWDLHDAMMIGAPVGRDFANFWIGGRLAIEGRLDILVDFDRYNDLAFQLFHHNARGLVFSYPPHILPLLVPFGALPFLPAVLLYSAGNLALTAAATRLLVRDRALAWAAVLSPAALVMVAVGHFGGLLAFLAVFILARGRHRPLLAGCCLALITIKPQFAAGLALFLLLVGQWRVVLAAIPATAALIAVSVLAFGIDPWIGFFNWTLPFHAQLLSDFQVGAFRTAMSVYTTARMVGLGDVAARVLQVLYGLPFLAAAAVVFVRRGATARSIALALFAGARHAALYGDPRFCRRRPGPGGGAVRRARPRGPPVPYGRRRQRPVVRAGLCDPARAIRPAARAGRDPDRNGARARRRVPRISGAGARPRNRALTTHC